MMVLLAGNARQRGGVSVKRMQLVPAVMLLAVIALVLGGCSSAAGPAQPRPSAKELALAQEKQAVLQAWVNAEEAFFYLTRGGPPAGFQAAIASIQPGGANHGPTGVFNQFFPTLARYEAGKALAQDELSIEGFWNYGVSGPATYSLGRPVVTVQSPTSATVTSCVTVRGWVVPSTPPPSGFAWPYDGQSNNVAPFQLVAGSWYETGGTNTDRKQPC